MPLSPFHARLALFAFLAIGGGVGANLLALQKPEGYGAPARSRAAETISQTGNVDLIGRLAEEAFRAPDLATAPTGKVQPRPSRRMPDVSGEAVTHRIGSFAPSSGTLALAALPGADPAEARRATIRSVQSELARRGYEPGPADGAPGLVTRAAVMAYEHDQGLPLTADPSAEVLAHLRHGTSAPGAAVGIEAGGTPGTGHADQVIRAVQQSLGQLGYLTGPPNGMATDETVRAIREFEMDSGLVPTGRISGPLMARLSRQTATARPQ